MISVFSALQPRQEVVPIWTTAMRIVPSLISQRVLGKHILPLKRNNLDLFHLNFLMSEFKSRSI